ncbi:hypothetical protein [Shimia sp. FJ5]|uniref:hypothetical protein n=1 Tax=Shimia sp. FJ5 TaxID=3079054 RepID=UPI0026144078|nr:hypothetical protein [Shimia sp. FJ5]MDV4143888.1 hypothetical protein [Shimia sp. FJ5]
MLVLQGRKWVFGAVALAFLAGCDEVPRVKMPDWDLFNRSERAPDTPTPDAPEVEEITPEVEETPPPLRGELGTTVVSLGAASEPGMWLKTPLVTREGKGRVYYNGLWLAVTLIPIEGASTAGSRMSLAAMRALEMPLTELSEVRVTAN